MASLRIDGKEINEFEKITVTGEVQFGTDWRIKKSGNNLAQERKETGTWNEKSAATP